MIAKIVLDSAGLVAETGPGAGDGRGADPRGRRGDPFDLPRSARRGVSWASWRSDPRPCLRPALLLRRHSAARYRHRARHPVPRAGVRGALGLLLRPRAGTAAALVCDQPASSGFRSSSRLWGGGSSLDGVGVLACLITALAYAAYVLMAERSLERGRRLPLLAWGSPSPRSSGPSFSPGGGPSRRRSWARAVSLLGRFDDVTAPVWLLLAYIVVLGTVVPFIFLVSAPPRSRDPRDHRRHARARPRGDRRPGSGSARSFAAVQIVGGLIVLVGVILAQTARREERAEADEDPGKMREDVAISRPRA